MNLKNQFPNNRPLPEGPPSPPTEIQIKTVEPANLAEDGEQKLEDGLAVVKSPSGLSVLVDGYGFKLSKKSERLVVKKSKGKAVWEFPIENVSDIFVLRNGSYLSSDLIGEAAERGTAIHILEPGGRPLAALSASSLTAVIETKRAQIRAETTKKGASLAIAFASGKILNQSRLLRYFAKYLTQTDAERANTIKQTALELLRTRRQIQRLEPTGVSEIRETIMGSEGSAANQYWNAVRLIIQDKVNFEGRFHQGAQDPVNCMLNYGYGILYAQIWSAVLRAGLEPYAGFLHTDRPGKPSLVLDLVEEFRAPIVDRTVIAMINLGQIAKLEDGKMNLDSRVELADKIFKRLETRETIGGKSFQVRSIIQMKAREVASFLCGRSAAYKSFRFKW